MTVRKVLVGPAADIVKEFYLAALVDRAERRILSWARPRAGSRSSTWRRRTRTPSSGATPIRCSACSISRRANWRSRMGLGEHLKAAVAIAKGLVRTMTAYDADLVEINPLAIVREPGADPVTPRSSDSSASTRRSRSTTRR